MEIAEVEETARQLIRRWIDEEQVSTSAHVKPEFHAFYRWLTEKHASRLYFFEKLGVAYMLGMWFNREISRLSVN
jgi:hypothetical protein